MENMFNNTFPSYSSSLSSSCRANGSSSSSQPDEFSLFLHQILLRSSSSAQVRSETVHLPSSHSQPLLVPGEAHAPSSCGYFPANVCSSVGAIENNDFDEFDCESEEGLEVLAGEMVEKSVSGRNSSKRTRAAEVHNLSEKRRRSRINEKLKALQNLIPNSNKTDKASMLDEAIEYLKQLQLQVQMLSMRNGSSFPQMCLPLQPSQMMMNSGEGNTSFHMNMEAGTINPGTSFGLESSFDLQTHPQNAWNKKSNAQLFED